MKIFFVLLLLLISFSVSFKEWWEESNVVQLDNNNFFNYVGKDKYVIVKFYTKWCKFCKILSPEYEKVIDELKSKNSDIVVARLEGEDNNKSLLLKYGIDSFPQVVLFYPGDSDIGSILHSHDRNVRSIINWIEIVSDISSSDDFLNNSKGKEINLKHEIVKEVVKEDESDYLLFEKENKTQLDQLRKKYLSLIMKYNKLSKELDELNSKLNNKIGIEMKIDNNNIQVGNLKVSKKGFMFYLFIFICLIVLIIALCICFSKMV